MRKLSSRRSFFLRWILVLLVTGMLGLLAWKNLTIEQDVVASIEKSRPEEAAIFHKLQGSGFFQNQVFIRLHGDDPGLHAEVVKKLSETGYVLTSAFDPKISSPGELYKLLPFLPEAVRHDLLSEAHQVETLTLLKTWLSAPGGLGMARLLAEDPLLLSMAIPKLIEGDQSIRENLPIIARREGDIDWERTRELYHYVKSRDKNLSFVSGDFYALENYDAVHHDIRVCSILSLLLSLIVFRAFCRQWSLLGFLVFGTAVSSIIGLLLAEMIDGAIYGLVLAFTSTLVSFNNETLVHLAGIDLSQQDKRPLIGIFSALGTTLIGFLVLLFSSSRMISQLALMSLGSLIGFIVFLTVFRDTLKTIAFRALALPQWNWSRPVLGLTFIVTVGLILGLPKPSYKTNLEEFRYASDYLENQTGIFAKNFRTLSFETLHAVPIGSQSAPVGAYKSLLARGDLDTKTFHPLAWYVDAVEQASRLLSLQPALRTRFAAMETALREEGLNINLDAAPLTQSLGSIDYLTLWEKVWPLPWYSSGAKGPYLLAYVQADRRIEGAIPLHPKAFYEFILSDLTRNLGNLFLIGLALMLVYLVPWQRQWAKVALIFLPLLIATLGLQLFFQVTHRNLTIVHVMGLALVIAVALDYASILVSTDHDPRDQGKVALTGGLTLCSFGSLLLARHPVLKELALVVVIGTLVAFVMALFTRLPERRSET